jgi:hypothetical protein
MRYKVKVIHLRGYVGNLLTWFNTQRDKKSQNFDRVLKMEMRRKQTTGRAKILFR